MNKDFVCDTCNIKVCKYCQDIIPVRYKIIEIGAREKETLMIQLKDLV